MKKSRNNSRIFLCLAAVIAAFALGSLFESVPVSLASTTSATPPSNGRGFFGRFSPFQRNKDDEAEIDEDGLEEEEEDGEDEYEEEDSDDDEEDENDDDDDEYEDEEGEEAEEEEEEEEEEDDDDDDEAGESENSVQSQRNQLLQQSPSRFLSPGTVIYRATPYGSQMQQQQQQQQQRPQIPGMPGQPSEMVVAAVANLLSVATRLLVLKWIVGKLAFETESKTPRQHFMWECLNDKYTKDDEIWNRVFSRVPKSIKMSQRKWENTIKAMRPDATKNNIWPLKKSVSKKAVAKIQNQIVKKGDETPTVSTVDAQPETSKTVVVLELSTMDVVDPDFLRFADIVTFLVGSNNPRKQMFGKDPEIVMKVLSPGGEVTAFAFAAAQVARLRDAGWKVTVCVDRFAASGGYMIASQATQILASPFAIVGSVGVITQALNFYEILKNYGIKSLVLKAGDSKMPITEFGEVTDKDIETTQIDLNETHESFINLCRANRPMLDPAVCNGRVLSGDMALEKGMIDRILTSDEYILEKISEGDLVMKLHLVSGDGERFAIWNALQILPHLRNKFKKFASNQHNIVGKLNASMDGSVMSKAFQIWGITSMIRQALMRSGPFKH